MDRRNAYSQSELALNELGWKPLSERRTQFVQSLMYKTNPRRLLLEFLKTIEFVIGGKTVE